METQFFDLKVWSETRWKKNGSDVREQNFARKHARLGWGESGARFPLKCCSLCLLISLSIELSLPPPPALFVPFQEAGGVEGEERVYTKGYTARDNSKLLFLQTK